MHAIVLFIYCSGSVFSFNQALLIISVFVCSEMASVIPEQERLIRSADSINLHRVDEPLTSWVVKNKRDQEMLQPACTRKQMLAEKLMTVERSNKRKRAEGLGFLENPRIPKRSPKKKKKKNGYEDDGFEEWDAEAFVFMSMKHGRRRNAPDSAVIQKCSSEAKEANLDTVDASVHPSSLETSIDTVDASLHPPSLETTLDTVDATVHSSSLSSSSSSDDSVSAPNSDGCSGDICIGRDIKVPRLFYYLCFYILHFL